MGNRASTMKAKSRQSEPRPAVLLRDEKRMRLLPGRQVDFVHRTLGVLKIKEYSHSQHT
jgi:hypothetical protein